jgi:hypothetical protein
LKAETYKLTKDWAGDLYCGILLRWDYAKWRLDISMPGYIKNNCWNTSTSCNEYNIAHAHRNQKDTAQTHSPLSHKIFRGN